MLSEPQAESSGSGPFASFSCMEADSFPALKTALAEWAADAVDLLQAVEPVAWTSRPLWGRDSDGEFRRRPISASTWPRNLDLRQLPSWRAVLKAIERNPALNTQFGQ